MRVLKVCAVVASALLVVSSSAFADVQLTIAGGRVSLKARDATLRQILATWAKVGQTQIINGDRVPGGPMTLELDDVTEEQALDVLLHAVSGYVAAPRAVYSANASRFDRIIVMPTAIAAPAATAAARVGGPTPVFPQTAPPVMQPSPDEDSDEEQPPPPQGGPARTFTRFPQPQVVMPQQLPPGAVAPAQPLMLPQPVPQGAAPQQMPSYPGAPSGAPAGVAVPGMVVPAPPQPNQPGMPVPPQPRRPGGGSDDDGAR